MLIECAACRVSLGEVTRGTLRKDNLHKCNFICQTCLDDFKDNHVRDEYYEIAKKATIESIKKSSSWGDEY